MNRSPLAGFQPLGDTDELIKRSTAPTGKKSFDAIEGEGINYERKDVEVTLQNGDGRPLTVLTYCGIETVRNPKIQASAEYVKHIFNGLQEHPSIPPEYVEYVRKQILSNNPEIEDELNKFR